MTGSRDLFVLSVIELCRDFAVGSGSDMMDGDDMILVRRHAWVWF